jgi:hypothetical protein
MNNYSSPLSDHRLRLFFLCPRAELSSLDLNPQLAFASENAKKKKISTPTTVNSLLKKTPTLRHANITALPR